MYDIDESGQPQLVFSTKLHESIMSLDGGYVSSATLPDLLVQTFSGRVGGTLQQSHLSLFISKACHACEYVIHGMPWPANAGATLQVSLSLRLTCQHAYS